MLLLEETLGYQNNELNDFVIKVKTFCWKNIELIQSATVYNARIQSDMHTLNVSIVPTHYLYASADAEEGYVGSTPFMDPPPP